MAVAQSESIAPFVDCSSSSSTAQQRSSNRNTVDNERSTFLLQRVAETHGAGHPFARSASAERTYAMQQ